MTQYQDPILRRGADAPKPPKVRGRPRTLPELPFAKMQLGDCFDIPLYTKKDKVTGPRVAAAIRRYRQDNSHKNPVPQFTIRVLREEGIVRCWRIA